MSAGPWTFDGAIASLGAPGELVTLVEETTFCVSERSGDIHPGGAQGLVLLETRFVSGAVLRVDGRSVEPLAVSVTEPFAATFYGRVQPAGGEADVPLVVIRSRLVGRGMHERLRIENHGLEPISVEVAMDLLADFADLFEVKEQRPTRSRVRRVETDGDAVVVVGEREGSRRRTRFRTQPNAELELRGGWARASWRVDLEPQGSAELVCAADCSVDHTQVEPRFGFGDQAGASEPGRLLGAWRAAAPSLQTDDDRLADAVRRGVEDIGALHIVDPDHPSDRVVAAGAPWFMTLFGRDALLTSYMAMIVDPELALGVLHTLARLQGRTVDPDTEEQPGRILHELRFDRKPSWRFSEATRYYGTVDATPLFVVLLGELRRWGVPARKLNRLLPAADAALRWLATHGDRDGDGYVEYQRTAELGLANQGWKDSWDAVRHRDGRLAEGPIALCEVQAYAYAAYLARSFFAEELGDEALSAHFRNRALTLREAFHEDFVMDDGTVALALDGSKRPVEVVTSNMGHCLWAGLLEEDVAAVVADRLLAPDMFSGWGVRTLSSASVTYNPVSYHNGSVWPHDNALIVAGLMRYGFVEHAHRIVDALLDVSAHHGGRLPELLAGTERSEVPVPVAYPTSCMPQAWSAATPLLLLRTLLRLDPSMSRDEIWLSPSLLSGITRLRLDGVRLGESRICISGDGTVEGLPSSLVVHRSPRHPLTGVTAPARSGYEASARHR